MPRATKPVEGTCRWEMRPTRPTEAAINGRPGILVIDSGKVPTRYLVMPLADLVADGVVLRGWSMAKSDGVVYHLDAAEDMRCDCPDATYHPERPQGCKHRKALVAALNRLDCPPVDESAAEYLHTFGLPQIDEQARLDSIPEDSTPESERPF